MLLIMRSKLIQVRTAHVRMSSDGAEFNLVPIHIDTEDTAIISIFELQIVNLMSCNSFKLPRNEVDLPSQTYTRNCQSN